VVTKDVPAYALVYGNPAKIQAWMCQCGIKLPAEESLGAVIQCDECESKYQEEDGKLKRI